jgi:DNA mismatch repair protein MutS
MSVTQEYFFIAKNAMQTYGKQTIVIMQIGSFMECYGNKETCTNIDAFSQICDLAVVQKNPHQETDSKIFMAGFKDFMIDKYIKKIVNAGYTCVVYMQEPIAKNNTNITRTLSGVFSPGTYLSNETQNLTNNLTCVWIEYSEKSKFILNDQVTIGISNIDIYTGEATISQFTEPYSKNPTTFDELERFISVYNPSETILISNMHISKIENVIKYTGIKSQSIHKYEIGNANIETTNHINNCEKQTYQKEILCKYYKNFNNNSKFHLFFDNNIACQSFCFLLEFAFQHNPHIVERIREPKFESHSERLYLANYSLKQLNIIEQTKNGHTGKYSCISKMLNQATTPMGKRKFEHILLNPITNVENLQREYDIIEYCLRIFDRLEENTSPHLQNVKDISKLFRFMTFRKIPPLQMSHIFDTINSAETIIDYVLKDSTFKNYLGEHFDAADESIQFCREITGFLDGHFCLDLAKNIENMQSFDVNFIKPGVNLKLDEMSESLRANYTKLHAIQEYFNSIIKTKECKKQTKFEYVKVHEPEKTNVSLVATDRRCMILKSHFDDKETIVNLPVEGDTQFKLTISKSNLNYHKQTASNSTIIHTEINQLCKCITIIKSNMKDVIYNTYISIIDRFIEIYGDKMQNIIDIISSIDVVLCKAKLAIIYNLKKPVIKMDSDKAFVNVKEIRHLLIEHIQDDEAYVSNDVQLGSLDTDGMLLYGTNAVGKTCLIKAVGISVIMAQAGLFVPAKFFEYFPYKSLFTRILGNDNLFKGLSTFAVEMSELNTILKLSNKDSLILGDELCSGTEVSSAICIFIVGILELVKKKSTFMFATHLHEIVDYDEIKCLSNVTIKHMSVIYNKELDTLIYERKLKNGPGNNMYGLEVCKSLNLPDAFIRDAYKIRSKYHKEYQSLLEFKTSKYNAKKIIAFCEICQRNIGSEIHHLEPQKDANDKGFIETDNNNIFHKNKKHNLITLCERCHLDVHQTNKKYTRKSSINNGSVLL